MNFKDRWVQDEDGEKILFTVEMQRQLSEKGLPVEPEYLSEIEAGRPANTPSERTSRPRNETRQETRSSHRDEFDAPETIQIDPQTGKYIGRMKWYNVRKGYGFITAESGEDVFEEIKRLYGWQTI